MPSPRQYVAIVATWLVLMLIAGASEGAERATRIIGWVLVLAGMVVGPFGVRTIGLFNNIAANFRTAPSTPTQGVQAAGQGAAAGVQSAATNQG